MELQELTDSIEFDAKLVRDDFLGEPGFSGQSHWQVVLIRNGQSYSTEYSMGAAHRVYTRGSGRRGGPVKLPYGGRVSYDEAGRLKRSVPNNPDVTDVLYCLAMDAQGVDYNGFEDWCAEYGYDTDSRKAEKMYHACCETRAALKRLGFDLDQLSELYQDY